MKHEPRCVNCGNKGNNAKSYRLNARSWQEEWRVLCTPCRKKLGFTVPNYNPRTIQW